MLLTIPSAIGLIILAEPIISLIYQHGRFTAEATRQTAAALQLLCDRSGRLSGSESARARVLRASTRRNLPMLVSLLSIAVNFGLNWFFRFRLGWGHRGLALSTSLVAITNFLLLYMMMRSHTGHLETGALIVDAGKARGCGRGPRARLLRRAVAISFDRFRSLRIWQKAIEVTDYGSGGGAAFFGAAYLLRVAEVRRCRHYSCRRRFRSVSAK